MLTKTSRHATLTASALFVTLACSAPQPHTQPPGEVGSADGAGNRAMPSRLTADPATQQRWGITTVHPVTATESDVITLPGTITLNEPRTAQVSFPLDAQIVSVSVISGADVRRGQVVATVRAPALVQARASYLQARSVVDVAQRDADKGATLLSREAIDQREFRRRTAELEQARAQLQAAADQLESIGLDPADVVATTDAGAHPNGALLSITAPVTGRVLSHHAVAGQPIGPDSVLFVISDLTTVWASLDAREADLPHVAAGQTVQISATAFPGRTWPGRVLHVADVVDPQSRTVKVRVSVSNPDGVLRPNMYVSGDITDIHASSQVTTIPEQAVQVIHGTSSVFVRRGPNQFEAVPVERGRRLAGDRIIITGLSADDAVVVVGAFTLKAELLKSTLGGE